MAIKRDRDRIILTGSTSVKFLENAFHPDPETVRHRDEYFKKLDQIITKHDGYFTAEIPWLDLPE